MRETTHDHVIERLPWLVNGTLAEGERREVEEHLAACPDCRVELSNTRDAFELFSAHLPPRLLVAYAETPPGDRLTIDGETADRRSVDAHLAHCDDCREELELVRESRSALGAEEVARSWPEGTVMPFVRPQPEHGAPRRPWLPMALAASLLLAAVSAGGWWLESRQEAAGGADPARVVELERQLDAARQALAAATADDPAAAGEAAERIRELEATVAGLNESATALQERVAVLGAALTSPREDVWYAAPTPLDAGVVRGGDEPAAEVETIPAGVPAAVLVLTPDPARAEGVSQLGYRVLSAGGEELFSGRLQLFRPRDLTPPYASLQLPTAGLPAGTITVVLSAGEREIGRFAFRVEG